jgi:FAD/FMN-containing dehydrogenase
MKMVNAKIKGHVYPRATFQYDKHRGVHNALCSDRYPDFVALPETTMDVVTLVRAAKTYGLEISVKSGGHSYICNGIKHGGLNIDLRRMNKVELKPDNRSVVLGPGSNWGRVASFLPEDNFTVVHGQCLEVGVGGFLMGGGMNGVGTSVRHGSGSEKVLKYTLVTAKGEVATVTKDSVEVLNVESGRTRKLEDTHDLRFALGSAGSSFGIVTEFQVEVLPEPETKQAFHILYTDTNDDFRAFEKMVQDGKYQMNLWYSMLDDDRRIPRNAITRGYNKIKPYAFTMVDNRGGYATDLEESAAYLKQFGLQAAQSLATPNSLWNYETLMWTREEQEKIEPRAVATVNMNNLSSMKFLDDFMLHHPVFGRQNISY